MQNKVQLNPRHTGKGNKYCNSLTQHGGSSGISIKGKKERSQILIIGRRGDPNYRSITRQDLCLNEIVPKRFINYTLSHKGGSVHSSLKCSKEYIKDR